MVDTEKTVKIMPCLDMHEGRVVKGINFIKLRDAGDPITCAQTYQEQGADELGFLDISATHEGRKTVLDIFKKVAQSVDIPLTLGGGIGSLQDIEDALEAGASKVSMSSAAVRNAQLIEEAALKFGQDKITVAIDADVSEKMPSGYEVYVEGGRTATGVDAFEMAKKAEDHGAGTLLPTSKKTDGMKEGYDIELTGGIAERVNIPVVASGGAGKMEHFLEAVTKAKASVLLAASVFHFGEIKIPDLKNYLKENNIAVEEA